MFEIFYLIMNSVVLKKATLNDYKEVAEIEKMASSKTYSARLKENEIKNFIEKDFVFLIIHDQTTVGLTSFQVLKNKIAHCNGLAIYPKYRRKGFAKKAMNLLLNKMNKYQHVELVVHPYNNTAITLYLSLGFKITKWLNNHFGDNEPRLLMIRK